MWINKSGTDRFAGTIDGLISLVSFHYYRRGVHSDNASPPHGDGALLDEPDRFHISPTSGSHTGTGRYLLCV
jgi:hypothetical protein